MENDVRPFLINVCTDHFYSICREQALRIDIDLKVVWMFASWRSLDILRFLNSTETTIAGFVVYRWIQYVTNPSLSPELIMRKIFHMISNFLNFFFAVMFEKKKNRRILIYRNIPA